MPTGKSQATWAIALLGSRLVSLRRRDGAGTSRSAHAGVVAALLAVILTFAAWLRLPGQTRETIWAEDGAVFLKQALDSSFLGGVLDPYDGYLHLVPRMLSHLALRTGPLEGYADRITWFACACVGLVGAAVFLLSRHYIKSFGTCLLLAAIPALLPVGPFEVLGNTANLHWYMLWLMPWILIYPTRRFPPNILLAIVAFAGATSEIQTVLFLPLVVLSLITGRQWGGSAGMLVGIVMQFITAATFPRGVSDSAAPWDLGSIIVGWLLQAGLSNFQTSASSVGDAWSYFGGLLLVLPVAFLLAPLLVAKGRTRETFIASSVFIAVSAALWTAAQVFNNRSFMNYVLLTDDEWSSFSYLRYAAAPSMFALGALATAMGGFQWNSGVPGRTPDLRRSDRTKRAEAFCATTLVVILAVGFFPSQSARAEGPVWSIQVTEARSACAADPLQQEAFVFVAPRGWGSEQVSLSCKVLRQSVSGHEKLPIGGHESAHGRPVKLPTGGP